MYDFILQVMGLVLYITTIYEWCSDIYAYASHKRPNVNLGYVGQGNCYGIVNYKWTLSALLAIPNGQIHSKMMRNQSFSVPGSLPVL